MNPLIASGEPADVFICHATEDKEEIALPLANKLRQLGVSVWIDQFSQSWGSSLFSKINKGIKECQYGILS
jgi:histidyl-tRNA synthetase